MIMVTKTIDKVNVSFSASKDKNSYTLKASFSSQTNWVFIKKDPTIDCKPEYKKEYSGKCYHLTNGSKSESSTSIPVDKVNNASPSEVWVWWEDSLQANGTIDENPIDENPTPRGTLVSVQSQSEDEEV